MEQQQPRSWFHLPDVCLLLIFSKLPLSDMIRSVGRVCTNWTRFQRVDLRSRKTLVIVGEHVGIREVYRTEERLLEGLRANENPFGSNLIEHVRRDDGLPWAVLPTPNQILFNTLRVPGDVLVTDGFTGFVMDKLPNITHLTLKRYAPLNLETSSFHQLTRLISHYTTSLVSLKLECGFSNPHLDLNEEFKNNPKILQPLFNSINRLESLRHLKLNITDLVDTYFELSIWSLLATFPRHSNIYYPEPSLLASLGQYATTGDDDLRVEIGTGIELDELIRLDPQLAAKFTRVHVIDDLTETQHRDMQLFCRLFVSLHSLRLHTWGMPMTTLARYLSQLPELINLKLRFIHIPEELEEAEEAEEEQVPIHQNIEITQVPSVRLLNLDIYTFSHLDTEQFNLHQIFPNLQVLRLFHKIRKCKECHYDFDSDFKYFENNSKPKLRTKFAKCMHLARQSFRKCANLHTVKLDTWNELKSLIPQGLITRDQL